MATKQLQAFCATCDAMMPHNIEEEPNAVVHLLITLVTVGIWLPFWIAMMYAASNAPKVCAKCGTKVVKSKAKKK
jgi:hypothetical protein